MNFISKIKDIALTLEGKLTITLEVSGVDAGELTKLSQVDKLDVEIK